MLLAVGDVCLYSCSSHRPQVGRCGFGRRAIQHNKHLVLLALDEKITGIGKDKKIIQTTCVYTIVVPQIRSI